MLGEITSWFLIDRVGHRNLTFYGMAILTMTLMVTGGLAVVSTPAATKGTVALLQVYCYFYNATIGATGFALLTEIATSRLRAKTAAMGLSLQNCIYVSIQTRLVSFGSPGIRKQPTDSFSLQTMWAFVIPFLFNPDQANLGAKVTFIFGGLSILSTIYFWFFQPEVAGRSYEELDEMFMKRVPAREFKTFITDAQRRNEQALHEQNKE